MMTPVTSSVTSSSLLWSGARMMAPWYDDVTYVYDDVTCVYDDVTYVYDDVLVVGQVLVS